MFDFDALSNAIVRQTVLCVGDLMLDEFVYGEVSRISPEAPAPVIAVQRSETNIGGAGNVARNIASLGARCIFVGLIGEDDAGKTLKAALAQENLIESVLVSDPARPTTRKVRFVSEHFSTHMLRADWEMASPASADIEQKLIDAILPLLSRADIVLLSDYAKGVLTARVIRNVIDAARKLGKRVIVDPKSANFAIYRGATLLTPNRKEFAEATRSRADTEAEIADAAQEAMLLADCEAMLVTLSEHGMTLVPRNGEAIHVPGHPVKVRDVSGAGDTAAAVVAVALAAGADWETALRVANAAAAVAVSKKGTAVVTLAELRRKILPHAYPRGGGKDRSGPRRSRRASSGLAQAGLAGRVHQRLFRHSASRSRQGADRGARRLRPADRRPQQRRLGASGSRARGVRCRTSARGPRCWRRWRRSIWS